MGLFFIISVSLLVISWMFSIGGLYLAIKTKENGKVKKSKLWFLLMVIGECIGEISWYATIFSLTVIIVQKFI